MDLVEQAGNALDLVDEHPGPPGQVEELGCEERGIPEQLVVDAFVEQVDAPRRAEVLFGPRALPRAADAEEEEAATGGTEQPGVEAGGNHAVTLSRKMTA